MSLTKRYLKTYQNFSTATWINILAVFVMSFGLMMSSIFTLFLNQKGIGIREIGWIIATGGLGGVIGSYLYGIVAKYSSPTRIAQLSVFLFALTMMAFPFSQHISLFFVLLFLSNFWLGFFRPANNIMLFANSSPADHLRVMALNRVAFNLGLAFATMIGTALAAINFNLFFIFSAIMSVLATILLLVYNTLLSTSEVSQNAAETNSNELKIQAHSFSRYAFILLCLLFFGYNLIFNQLRITYSLFLTQSYFLSLHSIGLLFMLNFLLIVFVEVPLMARLKMANQLLLVMWGSIFVGLGLVILPFGGGFGVAIISVFLWSIGEILASSAFFVLASRLSNPHAKHFYMGVFHSIFSIALVLAPLAGSILYPMYHGYVLWISCGIISTLMTSGFIYLKQQQKRLQHAN
jgi:predicted MFS family arabinose efflux permease